jgi:hypothetical protein
MPDEEPLLSAGSKQQTAALSVRTATVADSSHLMSAPDLAFAKEARIQRKSSATSTFSSCDISGGSRANFPSRPCISACTKSVKELIAVRHRWRTSFPRACASSANFRASSASALAFSALAFASFAAQASLQAVSADSAWLFATARAAM